MDTELIKKLLEAGSHFGHNRSRWNPKMRRFIFGERSKIYIIDLEKTAECLGKARDYLKKIVSNGESILFVGTKKQAQDVIIATANETGMFYVKERWLGGTLTNFKTIRNSIKRLKDIEAMEKDGTFEAITKKERAILTKEMEKLKKNLLGIVEMKGMPGVLVVVDAKKEEIAVKEAKKLNIPIVAIIDTNSDPDLIDYPIPANDDAMRSIKFIIDVLKEGIMEGKVEFEKSGAARKAREKEELEEAGGIEIPGEKPEAEIYEERFKGKESKKVAPKKKSFKTIEGV